MLPKISNRKKIYYKVTNQEENHHGLQYNDGLIIDPKKFNDNSEDSCIEGGIYFTTKEYLHKFLGYGCWIRPVKIPLNAKVILDPSRDKYRADRLFFKPREDFNFYFNKLFSKKTFPKNDYWSLAEYYSEYFNEWFDKKIFPQKYYWYLAKYCSGYKHIWNR